MSLPGMPAAARRISRAPHTSGFPAPRDRESWPPRGFIGWRGAYGSQRRRYHRGPAHGRSRAGNREVPQQRDEAAVLVKNARDVRPGSDLVGRKQGTANCSGRNRSGMSTSGINARQDIPSQGSSMLRLERGETNPPVPSYPAGNTTVPYSGGAYLKYAMHVLARLF